MDENVIAEVLDINKQLLDCIAASDWETYSRLCDPTLTCFEPETMGQLVSGMEFHQFYFQLDGAQEPFNTTMASPNVRVMGDVAVVTYVRLNQRIDADGSPMTYADEETRVWQRQEGEWRHVHFHRSSAQG